jgi:hypothetical protein
VLVIGAAARMLGLLADLLHDLLAELTAGPDPAHVVQLQDNIRAGMARLEIVAGEARQERRTYLTHEFDPDALVRTVFRLRNDLIMIGRAAAGPLPEAITARLRDPLARVSDTAQQFLRAAADALTQRRHPPALAAVDHALENLTQTVAALLREGATRALSPDDVGRLFALGFALEQLRHDLADFGDRVVECAHAQAV